MVRIVASLWLLLLSSVTALAADYIAIAPTKLTYPKPAGLTYGAAYGRVSFKIEQLALPSQKYWIGELLKNVLGISDSGEYILALELIDPNATGGDKLIARKQIAHFVKNAQGTLITDLLPFLKSDASSNVKVQDGSYIVFSGDLSPRVPINTTTNSYAVVMQLYKSTSATLTNSNIISSAIDIINTSSSVTKFAPISAAEKTIYGQLLQFGFNIYQTFAQSSTLVASETKMSFIATDSNPAPNFIHFVFPFNFDQPVGSQICSTASNCFPNTVDVSVSFETYPSVVSTLTKGKFTSPLNWSQWLLQGTVAGQTVPQYLSSNDATRAFYAAIDAGPSALKKFAADKSVDGGCDALVAALGAGQYFSAPDVGALYWSLLNEYWTTLTSDPAGARCQSKYAAIYFDPYGLPRITTAESLRAPDGASAYSDAVKSKTGNFPATINGAIERLSSARAKALDLRALQGIVTGAQ